MSYVTKMVSTVRVYGLKWKLKKNWDLNLREMWKNLASKDSLIFARKGLRNILRCKLINPLGWAIGWIGKILTIPCLMKIIIPFGISLKSCLNRVKSIVASMWSPGVVDREHPIRKWRSLKGEN